MIQTHPLAKIRDTLAVFSRLDGFRPVAMLALAFMFVFALAVNVSTGTVAAAGNETDADSLYYGITILEWAVIALAFILLALFGWLKNIYLFFGFIFLVIVVLIVHFFG